MATLNTDDMAKRRHPDYSAYEEHYKLLLASYLGGQDYIDNASSYIVQHPFEDSSLYTVRTQLAYYLNYCRRVVEAYTNFIFNASVRRSEDPKFTNWFKNVDGKGTTIDSFMRGVSSLSSVFGFVDVLLDAPQKDDRPAYTLADVQNGELNPYLYIYTPLEAIDWSVDQHGGFNWVLYRYQFYEDSDVSVKRSSSTPYRVFYIDNERWMRWSQQDLKFKENGTNEFQYVPVVRCRNRVDSGTAGISLIADIAYVNRAIFNWCSLLTEQIQRQTFSQLAIPDDGTFYDAERSIADPDTFDTISGDYNTNLYLKLGTSWAFTFPASSGQPPQYISPNNQQIAEIWTIIRNHIDEIHNMVGLSSLASNDPGNGNKSKQQDFLPVETALKFKAQTLEDAENRILKNFCIQQGITWDDSFASKYPDSFDVLGLLEELEASMRLAVSLGSETLSTFLLKKLASRVTKDATTEERSSINSELDSNAGKFVYETSKTLYVVSPDFTAEPLIEPAASVAAGAGGLGEAAPSLEEKQQQGGKSPAQSKVDKKAGITNQGSNAGGNPTE